MSLLTSNTHLGLAVLQEECRDVVFKTHEQRILAALLLGEVDEARQQLNAACSPPHVADAAIVVCVFFVVQRLQIVQKHKFGQHGASVQCLPNHNTRNKHVPAEYYHRALRQRRAPLTTTPRAQW